MPDLIADANESFREAMRRAEESAGITRDAEGNEVYAEQETPSVVTSELQEAVPAQASDQPLTPEEPAVVADTSQEQQEPVALDANALQAEIARLQQQLEAKESFIGRQSSEIGELRAAVDEIRQNVQQPQPQAPSAPQVAITQDMIEANPAQAVQIAFQQGNQQALELAFNTWKDEDPFTAAAWLSDRRIEQERAAFEQQLTALRSEIETVRAPIQQNQEQQAWNEALRQASSGRPEFIQDAARIIEEVAPRFPHLVTVLQNGDAEAKAEVLGALYDLDRLGNPAQVQQELAQAAEEATAEAEAARAAAAAVVGQPNAGQGTVVELTAEQQEQQAYTARMARKPSLARGFTRG